MSATVDLAGGTVTIAVDGTLEAFVITNSVAGGHLVINAGASLIFDDASGAGFDPGAQPYDITILGNAAAPVTVVSASGSGPTHPWTMPPQAIVMAATRCSFSGYSGSTSSTVWTFNSVSFIGPNSPGSIVLRKWLKQLLTVEPWTGGYDSDGMRAYGSAYTVACRIVQSNRPATSAQGLVVVSSTQVLVDGTSIVTAQDRITLPDGTQPLIIEVKSTPGPKGVVCIKEVLT